MGSWEPSGPDSLRQNAVGEVWRGADEMLSFRRVEYDVPMAGGKILRIS